MPKAPAAPSRKGQGREEVAMEQRMRQPAQQQQQTRPQRPQNQQRTPQGSSQTAQGQEQSALEFFHQSGEGKFKKLVLSISQRGGVILRLSEKEGDAVKSIVFSLNRTELITLSREMELYLSGLAEGFADQRGRGYVVEFFHYGNNGQYKKLSVDIFRDGGLALVLRQGEKGKPSDGIVFALSRAEAIHLAEELRLLFYRGV